MGHILSLNNRSITGNQINKARINDKTQKMIANNGREEGVKMAHTA